MDKTSKFVIHKDGNNQEYKIVNFDNPEMVPDKGIKVVRAIKKSSRHQPSFSIRSVKDPITGIIFGVPIGLHEVTKNLRFQLIELNDFRQFDLSIPQDRAEWAVISRAPFLAGSPFQKGKPAYILEDIEADAEKKVKNIGEKRSAYNTMDNLSFIQIVDMARLCGGIDTKNSSVNVIRGELYEFIDSKEKDKGAKKFNEIWKSSNREVMTVFKRCESVGLVHFDVVSGQYLWKNTTQLGTSEPMAIEHIGKNPSLLMGMDSESKAKDSRFGELATKEEKEVIVKETPAAKVGDDIVTKQLEEMSGRMSEKEKLLDELIEKARTAQPVQVTGPVDVENAGIKSELRLLQERASALGMKHAFITSDPEKINEWIKEHDKPVEKGNAVE